MTDIDTDADGVDLNVSTILVKAREATGLSQKEVADQLFLTQSFIQSIDQGEFEKIPKPAFIKGYIRSYSRVVDLNGDEMVKLYELSLVRDEDAIEVQDVTGEKVGSNSFTGPVLQTAVAALAGLTIIVGLVWVLSGTDEPAPPATSYQASDVESSEISVQSLKAQDGGELISRQEKSLLEKSNSAQLSSNQDGGQSALIAAEISAETMAAVTAEDAGSADEPGALSGDEPDLDFAEAMPEMQQSQSDGRQEKEIGISRETTADGQLIRIVAGGDDELVLQFEDDCWVEIQDGDGSSIYGDLNRSGDTLRIEGSAPFEVLLGKGPAVKMEFNGEMVDVGRFTRRDQTAKVLVGSR